MTALRGDLSTLKRMKASLRDLPRSVAHSVAQRGAPALTGLTQAAFDGGRSVYGEARPPGVSGDRLTLRKTGALEADLRFVANGTTIRCVLGPRYAKYVIRYGILPNGAMPVSWSSRLGALVKETVPP